jgi:butyryl-CoA dehydrogenase
MAEEFYTVDASVSLTMISTVRGLAPLVVGDTSEQHHRHLPAFLATKGAPLAAFTLTSPAAAPTSDLYRQAKESALPRGGLAGRGSSRIGSNECRRHRMERTGCRPDHHRLPHRCYGRTFAWHFDHRCAPSDSDLIFEHAFETLGHRAHVTPPFRLDAVHVPARNLPGQEGSGLRLRLAADSFAGSVALIGIFGVALMRAAFQSGSRLCAG